MNPWLRPGSAVLPGTAVGVFGASHLTRMFAMAARRAGYRVHTFAPESDMPAGQVADVEITAPYDDLEAVQGFASKVGVVTFADRDVPALTAAAAAERAPVRPSFSAVETSRDLLRRKRFLQKQGLPQSPFRMVRSLEELCRGLIEIGAPALLKTSDGAWQLRVGSMDRAEECWKQLPRQEAVLEALVDAESALAVVAARGADGGFARHALIENEHRNRSVHVSVAPARVPDRVARDAAEVARCVLEELEVVGVTTIEFLLARDGKLFVDTIAPLPHDAANLTVDAALTSQFEQQLRAVCGLKLGATDLFRPASTAALFGELWINGEPDWRAAAAFPEVKLHLYGKIAWRAGRRMGHLTALAPDPGEARRLALAARGALTPGVMAAR